jgi:hypothetical protein
MATQSKRHIVLAVLAAVVMLCGVFWVLTTKPADRARAFDSPLQQLVSQSPVATPPSRPSLPMSGGRLSQTTALPRLTFLSPISVPGMQPRAYLPVVMQKYPLYLASGLKGLAGSDYFGNLSYDVWYGWTPSPTIMDPKFVRMVKCPTDYFLYTDTLRINRIEDIRAAADNDRVNHIDGRVWLIYNEPESKYGECGVESIIPNNPDPSNTVRRNPEWAADRYIFIYDEITHHDPQAKVFAGGFVNIGAPVSGELGGDVWWGRFLDRLVYRGALNKLDGAHLHAYPYWAGGCIPDAGNGVWCMPELIQSLNMWYAKYHGVGKRLEHRPRWITEAGTSPFRDWFTATYGLWNTQVFTLGLNNVMQPLASWFTGANPGYNAMLWFIPYCTDSPQNQDWCQTQWWPTFLYYSNGARTPLGERWNQFRP